MTVAALIAELEAIGIRLWEESGQIRFRSPKGVMTPERRAALRAQKQEILDFLQRAPDYASIMPDPQARYEPFPLSEVQSAYLLGRHPGFPYGGIGCHAYGELIAPELDPGRLEAAWRILIDRHDMLRAVIDEDGSQRVIPQVAPYCIQVDDLRGASRAVAETAIVATRAQLSHKVYPAGEWPLFTLKVTLADSARLHFSIDFLIADYISIHLLLEEFAVLYANPEVPLSPLATTFRDYQFAERKWRTGSRYERDREYWWNRIDSLPSAPELPVLERAEPAGNVRFGSWKTRLSAEEWASFQRRAGENNLTPSGAILAAYAEVIGRWSRSSRFTLDITLLQRLPLSPDVDNIVGDFTSVNLLSVDFDPPLSFSRRAQALQAQLWQDMDHRLCSGIEVIREIARRKDRSSALMPVVFTSAIGLNSRRGQSSTSPLGEMAYSISQTPQVWIDCQAMERQNQLDLSWDVREGVFPDGLIAEMFQAFEDLVRRLAGASDPWQAKMPVKLPETQLEKRRAVNNTRQPLPEGLLHNAIIAQALRSPERPAVFDKHGVTCYGDLIARAIAVAENLRQAQIGRGAVVAVLMEKGVEQVIGVLGTLLAGGAYLPVDTSSPALRRNQILKDSGAQAVLTQSWLRGELPSFLEKICVDELRPASIPRDLPPSPSQPHELAYVIYTSGSTGAPKGVMISHQSALNTVNDINRRFNVTADDRVLGLAQLGFDLSVYDIFGLLAQGGGLVLPDPEFASDPSHWARLIADHDITLWNSVPAQMQMLYDYLVGQPVVTLPSLRLAMLSGDWIPVALPSQVRGRLPGLELVALGGATEAAIWSVFYEIGEVGENWSSIPYGKPLANQTCHLLDSAMQPCPDWKPGRLYIGGIGLADGYLGDSVKTKESFIGHPETGERIYRTGDWARYLPDGNLEFLGRDDLQVKIHGHRIELAEIEAALLSHPAVGAAAVIAHGEVIAGRRLSAFVEPAAIAVDTAGAEHFRAEIAARAEESAAALRTGVDPAPIVNFAAQLDQTALLGMVYALRQHGLFSTPDARHSLNEILAQARVIPQHQRLVRRWLNALESNRLIERDQSTGCYSSRVMVDSLDLDQAWRKVKEMRPEIDRRVELLDYFRLAGQHLPELLHGELDPVQLLFPQGRVEIHEVAYRDNFLSRYLNRLVNSSICELARRHRGSEPFQILEVGAGVGGTSIDLIPDLSTFRVEYLFTDVSQFFLNNAKDRFSNYSWVNFALFDMNTPYRDQGLSPNRFDVVLCANVLHYARDANAVLAGIRELLKPGGWLVFIEMVRDNYQVLTSMEFLFDATVNDFEDIRRGSDATFINLEQWQGLLNAAGAATAMCLPRPDDPFSKIGFHVFAAQFKTDRSPASVADLRTHLAARLPEYMVTSTIELVDALPLTPNGKIDRAALQRWVPKGKSGPVAGSEDPANDLERKLAAIWSRVIGVPKVGRNQSFFEVGGDSLLAAQLAGRIREEVPQAAGLFFDSLLRLVLDDPTVAGLSLRLQSLAPEATTGFQPASPLLPFGGNDNGDFRIVVHDASGTLASYASLLPQLNPGCSLAGLVVSDVQSYLQTPLNLLLEQVATQVTGLLRTSNNKGFHLFGSEFGGILALEIASRLLESGSRLRSLTVLDGPASRWAIEDELLLEYLFVRGVGVDPVRLGFPVTAALAQALELVFEKTPNRVPEGSLIQVGGNSQLDGVSWCFRRLQATSREERLYQFAQTLAAPGAEPAKPDQVAQLYSVFSHSTKALAQYKARPYAGDITLLLPSDQLLPASERQEMIGFWKGVCLGELKVIDLAGSVRACLETPMVSQIAELLLGAGT